MMHFVIYAIAMANPTTLPTSLVTINGDPTKAATISMLTPIYAPGDMKFRFEKMDPDDLKSSRTDLEVHLYNNLKEDNPGIDISPQSFKLALAENPYKAIRIHAVTLEAAAKMAVMESTEWSDIIQYWMSKELKGLAENSHEIVNVAFGPYPIWRSRGKKKWVIDSRVGAKSPYETLEDGAILHVIMLQRDYSATHEIMWHPMAFRINTCTNCKKLEFNGVKLKKCANCRDAYYCDQTCQRADWISHKDTCMTCD
jgi:hypothetical protein